jgi:hypothetical protein
MTHGVKSDVKFAPVCLYNCTSRSFVERVINFDDEIRTMNKADSGIFRCEDEASDRTEI